MELIEFRIDKPNRGNKHWVSRSDVKGGGFWRKNLGRENVAKIGVSLAAGAIFLKAGLNPAKKITNEGIKNAAALAYSTSNSKKATRLIDKVLASNLSPTIKKEFSGLTGASKTFFAQTFLSRSGYTKVSINAKNNFTTWSKESGELLSVGSVGSNVLSFETTPVTAIRGYPVFNMDFRVNHDYSKRDGINLKEARALITQTKEMFQDHIDKLPKNTVVRGQPWTADGAGSKRDSIYQKFGFTPIKSNAYADDFLWGVKENGKFINLNKGNTEEIKDRVSSMINFAKQKNLELIEFRTGKARSAQTKQKISKGLKEWWDDQGTTKKIGLSAAALGGVAAIYGLSKGRRKSMSIGTKIQKTSGPKGSPTNPYVEQMNPGPRLNEKGGNVNHPQRRAGRTFTDVTGKVRKKGGFLPNFVTDNALVRRATKRPIDVVRRPKPSNNMPDVNPVIIDVDIKNAAHLRNRTHIPGPKRPTFSITPYQPSIDFSKSKLSIGIKVNDS
jgi:hypothetical protein